MIDKLAWLTFHDRRVLATRSAGRVLFYLPGGKREAGETDAQALAREVREELTVELVADSLTRFGAFSEQADGKPEGTLVHLTCYTGEARGTLTAAAEIEELAWLGTSDHARCSAAFKVVLRELAARGLVD
jgi:8-oxo-dGTP diphosphatase